MLGVAKQLPTGPLHKFVPWSFAGLALALITGVCFILGRPTNYVDNWFLYLKLPALFLAGLNALLFYLTKTNQRVQALGRRRRPSAGQGVCGRFHLALVFRHCPRPYDRHLRLTQQVRAVIPKRVAARDILLTLTGVMPIRVATDAWNQ